MGEGRQPEAARAAAMAEAAVDAAVPAVGAAGAVRPVDRLLALYTAVAAAALVFPNRPTAWPWLAVAHAVVVALALRVGPVRALLGAAGRRAPRATRVIGDAYPLLLIPALYAELAVLNRAVHGGRYFDDRVIAWEELLFGGQPSREMAAALPIPWLSELLHGAYLSYYLIIYGPPLALYLAARYDAFRRMVFALMLTFLAHYVCFIYFPVQGPRYLFDPPGGALADGPMYRLAHAVLEAGSSRGAAFPSSHVGIAAAQTLLVATLLPRWLPAIAPLAAGLAIGAVYGGFHYATDAVLGLAVGVALVAVAPRVRRALAPKGGPRDHARTTAT